jgi:transposase
VPYHKAGSRHIRSALYMPALNAKEHDPHVKAYFQHLLANGKKPLQAVCAIMRILLYAIQGMLKHNKPLTTLDFMLFQNVTDSIN